MRLIGKKYLEKVKRKNKGNTKLRREIDQLITDIEANDWTGEGELKGIRKDADKVHKEGFYFFNISVHRTLVLIEFEDGETTIVWVGNHQEYEAIFRNNKNTIRNWLRQNSWL